MNLWDRIWDLECILRSVKCFVVGHVIECSYGYGVDEEEWCDRCYWPRGKRNVKDIDDLLTMPRLLNRAYVWWMDRAPEGWHEMNMWLLDNVKLPSWWKY